MIKTRLKSVFFLKKMDHQKKPQNSFNLVFHNQRTQGGGGVGVHPSCHHTGLQPGQVASSSHSLPPKKLVFVLLFFSLKEVLLKK